MRRWAVLLLMVAAPAWAQAPSKPNIPNLLAALKVAPTEEAAAALEQQIQTQWAAQATPAVRLLLARGARELGENAPSDALDSYDAALDLSPDLLEAWRGRADARRLLGDYVGAAHDVEELLKREPNSFLAFRELELIAEARHDSRGALLAWQKLLELDPHTPGGQAKLADLKRRALGEEL